MPHRSATAALACLLICAAAAFAQPTPPVAPKITETPLPPAVQLPGPPPLPFDVPNRPLTAQEAGSLALHHQPSILAAAAGLAGQKARTQETESELRPSVSVGASYGKQNSNAAAPLTVTGTPPQGYQTSATLRQLLYDYNHTRDLVSQSVALERAAGANLTRTQADLVLQVKQAFYAYQQDVRLVGTSEDNVRNQQSHLALAQARLRSGLGLPSDVVRAETAVAQAIFDLQVARNNASVARVNLAELIGIDPRTPIVAAESGEPAVVPIDIESLTREGLLRRPEMHQAQANIDAANYGIKAARTTNAPQFVGSFGVLTRGADLLPSDRGVGLGVAMQWTPIDGGFTAGRVKEAQSNLDFANAQMASTRLAVISDVAQAYLNLKTAEQRAVTAEAEVANAEEGMRLAQGRYRAGIGVFIDVIDAQTALDTANINRVNAHSAVDQARAALAHAVGGASLR